ncbi:MAG TPA: hypothetical protein VIO38_15615 [Rariglobus sp.]
MIEPTLCASDHCRPPSAGGPRRAMRGAPMCEACEDRAWSDLQTVARVWPDTEAQLTAPNKGGDGTGVRSARAPGIDLNPRVVEARKDITNTLTFWVHLLIDEHETLQLHGTDPSAMARFIGSNVRHLTHHHDEGIALSIVEDAHRLARLVIATAYPKGARRYEPGIPCVEHATSDMGERVPCAGEYGAWVWDGMGYVPDLECSLDRGHVLTPDGFRRLGRTVLRMGATTNLANAISGRIAG